MAEDTITTGTDQPGTGTDGGAPAGGESLHDDIARAIEQVETRDAPPAQGKATATPEAVAPGERARGPDGRFLPVAPERPAAAPPAAPVASVKPGDAPAPKPQLQPDPKPPAAPAKAAEAAAPAQLRPPASWKLPAREHWAKLPPEVQQEVVRRETEVGRTLQESARSREALAQVQGVLGPFAANIRAAGVDAITAMGNFFKADNTLRHGSISEKAQLVADIIKNYGVDIKALDSTLAGQPAQADPNAELADRLRREMREQLQPVLQHFSHMQGQRQRALAQINGDATTEVENFGQDAAHEFFEDVRVEMADIIDLYTQRGQPITLQDAYDRAIKLNPQVSEIIAKRAEAERVNAQAAAAQRARRTAASISGSPAPAGSPGPASDDRRGAIEAAWDSASNS